MAFSFIHKYFGASYDFNTIPLFRSIDKKRLIIMKEILDKRLTHLLSSEPDALFDAVSALLGLCTEATFDSEAPMS